MCSSDLLGGFSLFVKAIFLFRKSSDGFDLSNQRITSTSDNQSRPVDPAPIEQVDLGASLAQILQDFGAGPLLLWPFLHVGAEVRPASTKQMWLIVICGAVLYGLGRLVGLSRSSDPNSK